MVAFLTKNAEAFGERAIAELRAAADDDARGLAFGVRIDDLNSALRLHRIVFIYVYNGAS